MTQEVVPNKSKLAARISPLESGEGIKPFGLDMRILMRSEDTGGTFSSLHCTHLPSEGPPNHMHENQDEYIYILEGEYSVTLDGETTNAKAGTMVFIPRNTVHSFKNVGSVPAKMLDWTLPGGQDGYFREVDHLAKASGFDDEFMKKTKELNAVHATHFYK